jgi:DnaJ like chaperone protein
MWGKVILGGVGAMLGGPIGAGIGVALGNSLFDSPDSSIAANAKLTASNEEAERQKASVAYFVCVFASLAKIAKADGQITVEEIKTIEQVIEEMGLNDELTAFAINVFRQAKNNDDSISEYLNQFAELIEYDLDLSNSFAGFQLLMVMFLIKSD